MKKLLRGIIFTASALLLTLMSSCDFSLAYHLSQTEDGKFDIGYSKRQAYISRYYWDGDEQNMTIEIPDNFNGVPVTRLGGYFGRGVPCPFFVETVMDIDEQIIGDESYDFSQYYPNGYTSVFLEFTVHINENLRELYYGSLYYGFTVKEGENVTVYIPSYRYTCDENNATFYAEDGILYYKNSGERVEWTYCS